MKSVVTTGVLFSYDKDACKLVVLERKATLAGGADDRQLLEFSFAEKSEIDVQALEQTLGQLIFYSLEKLTPNGLGFGNYADLLEHICEKNFGIFCKSIDLSNPNDQYDLATMMFSRGRRIGSWEIIGRAIELSSQASDAGHGEARRFLEEDLPVVRSRLVMNKKS